MPTRFNKTLKYNEEKLLKTPFEIYADLECLLIKNNHVKTTQMNLILKEKLYKNLVVTH